MLSMPNSATGHIKLSSRTSDPNHNFHPWLESTLFSAPPLLERYRKNNNHSTIRHFKSKSCHRWCIIVSHCDTVMQRIEDCGCRVYIWSAVWWLFIILWGFKKGGKTMSCCLIPTLVCVISWEYFSLNVSLSHCTNILYSLEFYTSSQPTMSTSTGTQKNDNQFIED